MAKLKNDPITQGDLLEFLDGHSDFSFEVEVLHALIGQGFACEHSGTYDDPSTKKPREFDIRATKRFGVRFLRFAVECKNVRPHCPLLVSCMPRREEEAFHDIVLSVDPERQPIEPRPNPYIPAMLRSSKNVRFTGEHTIYKAGEPVGKSCDQVGRSGQGEITSGDSGIYEKWAQALSSADDLTYLACSDGSDRTGSIALSLVFPVVVIPEGRLWRVSYDAQGARLGDPEQTDRCSYFVGRDYYHPSPSGGDGLTISHLEFVTVKGLWQFIDGLCGDDAKINRAFPLDYISKGLHA